MAWPISKSKRRGGHGGPDPGIECSGCQFDSKINRDRQSVPSAKGKIQTSAFAARSVLTATFAFVAVFRRTDFRVG